MKHSDISRKLIDSLKESKEYFIMSNRDRGREIALDYINEEILDYESFLLIETLCNEVLLPSNYSDCHDQLMSVLANHQYNVQTDLQEDIDEEARGKSMVCFNAIARGFVEGVMKFWAENKEKLDEDFFLPI